MALCEVAGFIVAIMFTTANLKAAPSDDAGVITFPPSSAQKWVLPDGLTLIVQEDHSAPVASVQAWCATGSVDEDEHIGAGLSHILEHMLFKGTKTRTTNAIAQKIQDVGGYINAYTSFDRTVFWIDVPKDGVATGLDVLSDSMMNSTLPPEEYLKEQKGIRREFAMNLDDPDRMTGLLLFATAYQKHPYRLPVIGQMEIYNQLTQEQVMQYYKTRYVPNNLTFIVAGDVDPEKVHQQLADFFKAYPEKSLKPVFIPEEPTQLGRLLGNENRFERLFGVGFEKIGQLLMNLFWIDISRHDEGEIVWNVARLIILHHLLLGELIINFHLPDDWQPIGMFLVGCGEEKQAGHSVGIVQIHCELTANHLLLFQIFLGRKS